MRFFFPRLHRIEANAGRRTALCTVMDEVKIMSPKELLYIEDALGHTSFLTAQCRAAAAQLTDPVLRQQAQQLADDNQKLFDTFYKLV